MMRSNLSDIEGALPRRDADQVSCSNPFCVIPVRIRGEFCRECVAVQDQQKARLRADREQRA